MSNSSTDIADRLVKLRALRENLCQKSKTWQEAFHARDWVIQSLKDVITEGKNKGITKEDIINKLEDFICVIEPDGECNEDDE